VLADYHMHLERGGLDPAYLARFVRVARARGIDEIGITEHAFNFAEAASLLDRPAFVAAHGRGYAIEDYLALLGEAREAGLPVRTGVEMDYVPGREAEIRDFLAGRPWDFVIGSVHWLGDWGFDLDPSSWEGRDVAEAYRRYFGLAERAVRSGLFDVLGHPDVIKVFGHRPPETFAPELEACYDRLARAAAEARVALEVSSAGLRRPAGEIYPDGRLLRRARSLGVPVTLASDAHEPEEAGWAYPRLLAFARGAGYRTLTVFEGRRGRQEPMG